MPDLNGDGIITQDEIKPEDAIQEYYNKKDIVGVLQTKINKDNVFTKTEVVTQLDKVKEELLDMIESGSGTPGSGSSISGDLDW